MMVTDFYWPLLGGVEQHVRSLSHELCARSHRVTVVTMDHGGSPAAERDGPVDVVRIPTTTQRLERLFRQPRPWAPPIHDPSAALTLRRLVAERRPDVVHGHDWLARSVIGSTAGRPLVSTLHYYTLSCAKKDLMRDGEPCAGPGPAKCVACAARHYGVLKGTVTAAAQAAGSALERRAADHVIAVSRATATGNGLALDDERVHVIPNFLPPPALVANDEGRSGVDDRLGALPAEPFFLYVGDFRPTKGFDVLLQAYSQSGSTRPLVAIGKRWENWPFRLPAGAHVFDEWPNEAVLAAFARARAAVVPSRWAEPFGIVAIEAMSAGAPVIASRTGGLVDIVRDGATGRLVAPGSPDELRTALEEIDRDDQLHDRWSANALVAADEYRAASVVPRIEAVYELALAEARR